MRTSDSTANIAPALSLFLAGLTNPPKTEEVKAGQKHYSFAPLPDILDQVREDLGECGLGLTMEGVNDGYMVGSRALMMHTSGEWIEFGPLMLPAGETAQTYGSALTYSRRYLICAILNIAADEDDDGAKASKATKGKKDDWGKKVDAVRDADARRGNEATDRAVDPGEPDSQLAAASGDPGSAPGENWDGVPLATLDELIEAYGTRAKALLAARRAFGEVSIELLTVEQARTLIEEAP